MRKYRLLLFGSFAFVAALALAQTIPSTLPPRQWELPKISLQNRLKSEVESRTFSINGTPYLSTIAPAADLAGPEWEPTSPLPIGFVKAEDIARAELRKLVSDESRWQVSDFHLSRFRFGRNWYFAVTLVPDVQIVSVTPDSFTVLIDITGKPGQIRRIQAPKMP